MTKEEIDSWIEQHIVCSKEDICIPVNLKSLSENLIAWAKMVANKFYNIGYKQGQQETL